MSQMIANQLTTRMRLLKGDLPKPTAVMPPSLGPDESVRQTLRPPPGLPLSKLSGPCRPPPGFSVGDMGRFPPPARGGIGETIANLQASIVDSKH